MCVYNSIEINMELPSHTKIAYLHDFLGSVLRNELQNTLHSLTSSIILESIENTDTSEI